MLSRSRAVFYGGPCLAWPWFARPPHICSCPIMESLDFWISTPGSSSKSLPSLKYGFLVVPGFRNTFEDIVPGGMCILLLRDPQQQVQRSPTLQSLLHCAYIKESVMEVVDNFLVRLFPQECLICMYAVSGGQSALGLRYMFLDVFEQVGGCLFGGCSGCKNCCGQPILPMGSCAPLVLCCLVMVARKEGLESSTILSIVCLDWWITAPHPISSIISKFPFVIMQNISITTSLSMSRPVIYRALISRTAWIGGY